MDLYGEKLGGGLKIDKLCLGHSCVPSVQGVVPVVLSTCV